MLVPNFKLLALPERGLTCSKVKVCCRHHRKVIVIAHPNYVWLAKNVCHKYLENIKNFTILHGRFVSIARMFLTTRE